MRKEKQYLLDEIHDKLKGAQALVLTRYKSLTPNLSNEFRNALRGAGCSFTAVKKRILVKAAEKGNVQLDQLSLDGHIGMVMAHTDPVQATKALFAFIKSHQETLEILGGQFEGQFCTAADVKTISELPSLDGMRSQLLATFEAPMSHTLSAMEALLTSLLYCLENKSQDQKE